MIEYSCNYTSRESNGPMSGVKIQAFRANPALFSELWSRVQDRVTLYVQKAWKMATSGGNDGGAARKVMCDDKQACMY